MSQAQAPKPIDTVVDGGDSEAFIPYPPIGENLEHVPIHVRPDVYYYQARMAFYPTPSNCICTRRGSPSTCSASTTR